MARRVRIIVLYDPIYMRKECCLLVLIGCLDIKAPIDLGRYDVYHNHSLSVAKSQN